MSDFQKTDDMRALFYLLFLACLVPLLCCRDLVRLPTSRFQPVLLSVHRGFLVAVGNGGENPNEG